MITGHVYSFYKCTRSDPLGLQPAFEQCDLPELRMALGRELALGVCQQAIDIGTIEQPTLPGARRIEHLADEIVEGAADVFERRHREVAFRPIDHFVGHQAARSFLENVLAAVADFQFGRNPSCKVWSIGRALRQLRKKLSTNSRL